MIKPLTVKVKTYDDGEVGIDIEDILQGTTTRLSTVKYYSIDKIGKSLRVVLYNKNKRKIKLKNK